MGLNERFWRPTPKKWRKIGYALLTAGTALSLVGVVSIDELMKVFSPLEIKILITAPLITGFFGKLITSLYTEENPYEHDKDASRL